MTAVTERPRVSRLVLSRPGKRIVVLFIVLGVIALAGAITVAIVNGSRATHTAHKLDTDHSEVVSAYASFVNETTGCAGRLPCLHDADAQLATTLEQFRKQFDGLRFPPQSLSDAQQVRNDIDDQIRLVRQLEAAATPAEYNAILSRLQQPVNTFNTDYVTLRGQLPA